MIQFLQQSPRLEHQKSHFIDLCVRKKPSKQKKKTQPIHDLQILCSLFTFYYFLKMYVYQGWTNLFSCQHFITPDKPLPDILISHECCEVQGPWRLLAKDGVILDFSSAAFLPQVEEIDLALVSRAKNVRYNSSTWKLSKALNQDFLSFCYVWAMFFIVNLPVFCQYSKLFIKHF